MINRILKLSKVLIKEYFENLEAFNKKKGKKSKKTLYIWLTIILIGTVSFYSFKIIEFLNSQGQEQLFLKIYLPILAIIFTFQSILVSCNVFFFSKDLEYIVPLPIKPIELLIAKFNNVISITYAMEAIFLLSPLLMFGTLGIKSISYYFIMLLVLILFPIFLTAIVNTIMLVLMQIVKFIKNKEILQIVIVMILSFILTFTIVQLFNYVFNIEISQYNIEILNNKIDELNSYFIIINPCISLLDNLQMSNICYQFVKLILINSVASAIFLILGKKIYFNNLLKNMEYINKKKNMKIRKENKYRKNKKRNSYIKNEIKKIIKNPAFFNQCIFQYVFIVIMFLVIINLLFPMIKSNFETESYINQLGKDNFILQCMCIILGIIQILFTLNNISITAISRDGFDARLIKYIPVSLYKQFLWKNIPQILLNICGISGVILVIAINIKGISILYYVLGIVIAMLFNVINSFLMLIVNLNNPNLDWAAETAALKDNKNKTYQYVITIVNILMLIYFTKVLKDINIVVSILIIIAFYTSVLILLIIYVKKNVNKLFRKIF